MRGEIRPIADPDSEDDSTEVAAVPFEVTVARMIRARRTGTLRLVDRRGEEHTLLIDSGLRILPRAARMRLDHTFAAAEEIFRRSAAAEEIHLTPTAEIPEGTPTLDAFEALYRGVRARGNDSPNVRAFVHAGRPFVLHRDAHLEAFPLTPAERKVASLLAALPLTLDALMKRRVLPEEDLITFLYFLGVTHSAFREGDDTASLDPLGHLTPEEVLSRLPPAERGRARLSELLRAAVMTATLGAGLLWLLHWTGDRVRGTHVSFHSVHGIAGLLGTVLLTLVQLIAYSHRAAETPKTPLLLAFFGVTLGVALWQEAAKAFTVLDHYRRHGTLSLRGALSLGLASGAGLGLADALLTSPPAPKFWLSSQGQLLHYASRIALHAVWSASAATSLHRRRKEIRTARNFLDNLATLGAVIALPVLLHGTFDTALRRGSPLLAALFALASLLPLLAAVSRK
ncbi:MAG: hypothetical protein R3B70_28525 [Polyangiaceae bacterium]